MRAIITILTLVALLSSCKDEGTNNYPFIPDVPVSITVNTELPSYYHLQNLGTYSILNGGNKGIILVHNFDDVFYAVERTCTFHPDVDCGIIQIDTGYIRLRCGTYSVDSFESCCNSAYAFDGNVIQGPSTFPLRLYNVFENGNLLTIRN